MDSFLIVILIAFAAGIAVSWPRPSREPQMIYVVAEPEQRSSGGCLLPLIFIVFALIVLFGLR
jgi:hypothetical protein